MERNKPDRIAVGGSHCSLRRRHGRGHHLPAGCGQNKDANSDHSRPIQNQPNISPREGSQRLQTNCQNANSIDPFRPSDGASHDAHPRHILRDNWPETNIQDRGGSWSVSRSRPQICVDQCSKRNDACSVPVFVEADGADSDGRRVSRDLRDFTRLCTDFFPSDDGLLALTGVDMHGRPQPWSLVRVPRK